jgi:hypothetical protein
MPSVAAAESVKYLVPLDTVIETAGAGAAFEVGALACSQVFIVLRISQVIEQESLEVSLWGSADGKEWGSKPLFSFPQKFYQGASPAAVDLRQRPDVKFLQVRWGVNRWGRGSPRPYFKFGVELQGTGG